MQRRGFIARRVLVASAIALPLAVLIALLTTGVMSRGMLGPLPSVALAACLHPWSDGGTFLYPCDGEDVIVGNTTEANADHLLYGDGRAIFNEQGLDADCRIEGDTDTELFCTDASTDRVGIGANDPTCKLDVRKSGGAVLTTNSVLAVQNNANSTDSCDVNIIGGATGTTRVCFGDTDDPTIGEWIADASTDECRFVAEVLKLDCGLKIKRTAVTTTYTIAATDYYISCDSSGGAFAVTLPSATSAGAGKVYVLKNKTTAGGGANTVTVTPAGSDTIDGGSKSLTALQGITIVSDGASNWEIIAKPN